METVAAGLRVAGAFRRWQWALQKLHGADAAALQRETHVARRLEGIVAAHGRTTRVGVARALQRWRATVRSLEHAERWSQHTEKSVRDAVAGEAEKNEKASISRTRASTRAKDREGAARVIAALASKARRSRVPLFLWGHAGPVCEERVAMSSRCKTCARGLFHHACSAREDRLTLGSRCQTQRCDAVPRSEQAGYHQLAFAWRVWDQQVLAPAARERAVNAALEIARDEAAKDLRACATYHELNYVATMFVKHHERVKRTALRVWQHTAARMEHARLATELEEASAACAVFTTCPPGGMASYLQWAAG